MTNKNWTGNQNSVHSIIGASSHSETDRQKDDYYATHPKTIDDLFSVEDFSEHIWEPATGGGHLSKRMEQLGKNVYSTDLVDRGFGDEFFDFLESDREWEGDIITNPPYKYAKEFVIKSMQSIEEGNKVAMFLKLTFLESIGRIELFKKYPPKRVWVYSKRQITAKNGKPEYFEGSSAVCFCWFVWEKGFTGDPKIKWITPKGELEFDNEKNI